MSVSLEPAAARPSASSDTLTVYGRALMIAGQIDASERVLQQATSTLPVEPVAFYYLSGAAQRRGHVSAAREALVKYQILTDDSGRADVKAGASPSPDPARRAARPPEN